MYVYIFKKKKLCVISHGITWRGRNGWTSQDAICMYIRICILTYIRWFSWHVTCICECIYTYILVICKYVHTSVNIHTCQSYIYTYYKHTYQSYIRMYVIHTYQSYIHTYISLQVRGQHPRPNSARTSAPISILFIALAVSSPSMPVLSQILRFSGSDNTWQANMYIVCYSWYKYIFKCLRFSESDNTWQANMYLVCHSWYKYIFKCLRFSGSDHILQTSDVKRDPLQFGLVSPCLALKRASALCRTFKKNTFGGLPRSS